jgi:hypothetical protein
MHYVRYADDFIITLIGTKKEALEIKNNCAEFHKGLQLTLSQEKTLITNSGKGLGKPINSKHLNNKKAIMGQTEEKIYQLMRAIGISEKDQGEEITLS